MEKRELTLADYAALVALSLRNCFWSRDAIPDLGRKNSKAAYYTVVATAALCISGYNILSGLGKLFEGNMNGFLGRVLFFGILLLICFDPQYAWYNIRYFDHTWWKDTEIPPSWICSNFFDLTENSSGDYSKRQGLYGEYLASMAAERLLMKNKDVRGTVMNGVLIPTDEDGGFTEADIISVSEYGIHVMEVKNWRSFVEGDMDAPRWGNHSNPFSQNLYHCNMLYDYLYKALPDCPLRRRNLNEIMINVVLFTSPFFFDSVNKKKRFYRSYGGYTMNYLYLKGYVSDGFHGAKKVLSAEDVAMIEKMLRPLVLNDREKTIRMNERKAAAKEKETFGPEYCVKEIMCPDIAGKYHEAVVIERTLSGHKSYFDYCDYRFRAMPNCREVIGSEVSEIHLNWYLYKDEWEQCPREAMNVLENRSQGKNIWINSLDQSVNFSSKTDETLRTFQHLGVIILNNFLNWLEMRMYDMEEYVKKASEYAMVGIFLFGLFVFFTTHYNPYVFFWTAVGIWFFSSWGIFQLFFIGMKALIDFNSYTNRILDVGKKGKKN